MEAEQVRIGQLEVSDPHLDPDATNHAADRSQPETVADWRAFSMFAITLSSLAYGG